MNIRKILWIGLVINQFAPIDKIVTAPLIYLQTKTINTSKTGLVFKNSIIVSFLCLIGFFLSSSRNLLLLFPFLFILLAELTNLSQNQKKYHYLKIGLTINILYGLISILLWTGGVNIGGSITQLGRGLSFIKGPSGFSPTLQVYGTLCVVWLIFDYISYRKIRPFAYIVILALVLTLNRASFILLFLFFLTYKPYTANLILLLTILLLALIPDIYFAASSVSTLQSREELRYGAFLSYWTSTDPIIILFGKGTHLTSVEIASKTIWERTYIENGLDFIFHSYGVMGFIIYLCYVGRLIYKCLCRKLFKFSLIVSYYYLVEQIFTNEFLSSSFCIFTILTLYVIKNSNSDDKSTKYRSPSSFDGLVWFRQSSL